MEKLSSTGSFGGRVERYKHASATLNCDMEFGVYLPPQADTGPVPVLWWLSGLTCTDENFMQKAGAQRLAAQLGLAIVCPDTSPRGTDLPGEHDDWDFGSGAGFYVNATQAPWDRHYRMYDYVTKELPALVEANLPVTGQRAVSGHSMGGHGALLCALREPERYASVSAFAPICHPSDCPWGVKAFSHYLGDDRNDWRAWDATQLLTDVDIQLPILIDQGADDPFLGEQLKPGALEQAAICAHHPLEIRLREGYDHSYFFVASFIDDHLRHHAKALGLIASAD
ncbi:S-formylglutathione hydrolase [Marinihelvus fidelis]|uniref:S-formylglutathione hydrolase n=1 Tax=Marinihelvus fidelis TaxID=2613842 RepID=A0A5N0TL00_9GAMM|nr:S-formylglutathione hydrolase [Marinihelvus fidelis]KAA9133979.1 S-formylglutathione hydrolase [Marinihelvus fidelis]